MLMTGIKNLPGELDPAPADELSRQLTIADNLITCT
jgi:hypothetical protein